MTTFKHAVHLVVTQAAQFGAGDFVISRFSRGEMHVDGKTGHRVLLEAHVGNKKTVDHILRLQGEIGFAVHGKIHDAADHIVLGVRIVHIHTQRVLFFRADVLGVGRGISPVLARIAEEPGELSAGGFHFHRIGFSRFEPFGCPDMAAHQVQSHKEDGGQSGPNRFELDVAVGVFHRRGAGTVAIFPRQPSQDHLRCNKHNAHDDQRQIELMIDPGGGSRRSVRPPTFSDKKVSADQGDQPDHNEKDQAHLPDSKGLGFGHTRASQTW